MDITTQHLNLLTSQNELLVAETEALKQQIIYLKEQIANLNRRFFGKKSERIIDETDYSNYFPVFAEYIAQCQAKEQLEKKEHLEVVKQHTRIKYQKGNDFLQFPEDLPVEKCIIDITEEEKICSLTGLPLIEIGRDITRKLAKKTASFFIKETIRIKYKTPQESIKAAPLPPSILPRCQADNSLLADIMCMKFADHLPLNRIAEIFSREGVNVSRQLLSQWVIKIGTQLKPLCVALERQILGSENIFIDETPVDLLEKGKGKVHSAQIWAVCGGKINNPKNRIFYYAYDRKTSHAHAILSGYKGVFHSDKFVAYVQKAQDKEVTWCPCWAHIRRKFIEAEGGNPVFTKWILRMIKHLYWLDRIAWNRTAEERLQIRLEKSLPIIKKIKERIDDEMLNGKILSKSKFKEALIYTRSLFPYVENYTKHAYAHIDNNVVERAIRPIAIGRKNWMFFGSEDGGKAAAVVLSLVQTCRAHSINPREYLKDIFDRLPDHCILNIDDLLPENWKSMNS